LGFPFDTATSYRTGTRFGPNAIRQGSRAASLAYMSTSPGVFDLC
jgi:agmatinase